MNGSNCMYKFMFYYHSSLSCIVLYVTKSFHLITLTLQCISRECVRVCEFILIRKPFSVTISDVSLKRLVAK